MIQQDTIFNDIRHFSELTAQNTAFSETDQQLYWYTFISCAIAIVAFFISIAALYYTIRTLKSQERTERNTRSISKVERKNELQSVLYQLWQNTVTLLVISFVERDTDYQKYPAERYFLKMLIPDNPVTLDSFWDNKQLSYTLSRVSARCKLYNQEIGILQHQLQSRHLSRQKKGIYIENILLETLSFFEQTLSVLDQYFSEYLDHQYFTANKELEIVGRHLAEFSSFESYLEAIAWNDVSYWAKFNKPQERDLSSDNIESYTFRIDEVTCPETAAMIERLLNVKFAQTPITPLSVLCDDIEETCRGGFGCYCDDSIDMEPCK